MLPFQCAPLPIHNPDLEAPHPTHPPTPPLPPSSSSSVWCAGGWAGVWPRGGGPFIHPTLPTHTQKDMPYLCMHPNPPRTQPTHPPTHRLPYTLLLRGTGLSRRWRACGAPQAPASSSPSSSSLPDGRILNPPTHPPTHPQPTTQPQPTRDMDESATNQPKKLVMLQARDGTLDEPVDAAILLPSDLLKSMLPDKCR